MSLFENETIEFKREYVDDIKKTIIAFANTSGGELYVGVEDDGTPVGVPDIDEVMLRLSNSIRDSIKPDITLFVNYQVETLCGKTIIKVSVQKGTSSPYYLTNKGIRPEGIYIRHGASTVPANETAILKMIKETDGEKYEDIRSLNQQLTFVEAAKEFKAYLDEKSIDLHEQHHNQVNKAISDFNKQLETDRKTESIVDVTLSPQDKKSLSFLAAFSNMNEVSDEQKDLVKYAQEAIRVHKFNQLPKKVNKLATAVKKTPMRIDLMINMLIDILEEFPLKKLIESESEANIVTQYSDGVLPEIIISESFMK